MRVRDVMTRDVISVAAETPLKEVARTLAEQSVSGLPVVDAAGAVVGVISEADFLFKEQGSRLDRHPRLAWIFPPSDAERAAVAKADAATAGEAMSSPALVIEAYRPLREAAALMAARRVNRLPVVEDGVLVGILSRADLVAAYLQPDEELERILRQEVIRDTMWIDPAQIDVAVEHGIATLNGHVDRRSTAEILGRLAAQTDGIVRVVNDLTWQLDDRSVEPVGRIVHEPGAASILARELRN